MEEFKMGDLSCIIGNASKKRLHKDEEEQNFNNSSDIDNNATIRKISKKSKKDSANSHPKKNKLGISGKKRLMDKLSGLKLKYSDVEVSNSSVMTEVNVNTHQDELPAAKISKKSKKDSANSCPKEDKLIMSGKKRRMDKLSGLKLKSNDVDVSNSSVMTEVNVNTHQDELPAAELLSENFSLYPNTDEREPLVDLNSYDHTFKLKSSEYQIDESRPAYVQEAKHRRSMMKLSKINERKCGALPTQHPDAEKRTIFVGNVDKKLKRKDISSFFKKYGKIETVRIRGIAGENLEISKKEAITTKKIHEKRETVIAYVRFTEVEFAEKALIANGDILLERHLRVDRAIKGQNSSENSIFVGNLPYEADNEKLHDHFAPCGKITDVRIVRSQDTGAAKGFGFISFESNDSVELALLFDGKLMEKRRLRVKTIVKKPKVKNSESTQQISKEEKRKSLYFMKEDKPNKLRDTFKSRQQSKQSFCGFKIADNRKRKRVPKEERKRRFTAQLLNDRSKVKKQNRKNLKNKEQY